MHIEEEASRYNTYWVMDNLNVLVKQWKLRELY